MNGTDGTIAVTPPVPALTYEEDPIQTSSPADPGTDSSPWNILTDFAEGALTGIGQVTGAVAAAQVAQAGGYSVPNLGPYPFQYGSGPTGGVKVAPTSIVGGSPGILAGGGIGGLIVLGFIAWLIFK